MTAPFPLFSPHCHTAASKDRPVPFFFPMEDRCEMAVKNGPDPPLGSAAAPKSIDIWPDLE